MHKALWYIFAGMTVTIIIYTQQHKSLAIAQQLVSTYVQGEKKLFSGKSWLQLLLDEHIYIY